MSVHFSTPPLQREAYQTLNLLPQFLARSSSHCLTHYHRAGQLHIICHLKSNHFLGQMAPWCVKAILIFLNTRSSTWVDCFYDLSREYLTFDFYYGLHPWCLVLWVIFFRCAKVMFIFSSLAVKYSPCWYLSDLNQTCSKASHLPTTLCWNDYFSFACWLRLALGEEALLSIQVSKPLPPLFHYDDLTF